MCNWAPRNYRGSDYPVVLLTSRRSEAPHIWNLDLFATAYQFMCVLQASLLLATLCEHTHDCIPSIEGSCNRSQSSCDRATTEISHSHRKRKDYVIVLQRSPGVIVHCFIAFRAPEPWRYSCILVLIGDLCRVSSNTDAALLPPVGSLHK